MKNSRPHRRIRSAPRPTTTRFRPTAEALEGRALLSGASDAMHAQDVAVVQDIYRHLLHHDPTPVALTRLAGALDRQARTPLSEAVQIATSPEYLRAHRGPASFVRGLAHDALGSVDPQAEAFWTTQLQTHRASRAQVAASLLQSPGSFLTQTHGPGGGLQLGAVTGVTVVPAAVSATSGNQAMVSLIYNRGDLNSRVITVTVSGPGTYVLNQTGSWGVINNTGSTWRSYGLTIQTSQSSAQPAYASASDQSNQLPTVTRTADATRTVVTFSGGRGVPTGPSPSFMPQLVFTTRAAGSVVLVEQPSLR
jgi:hypothetical protein